MQTYEKSLYNYSLRLQKILSPGLAIHSSKVESIIMFRLGKRNFSLRDSPNNKLSSLSPLPTRLQSASPAKRLKFGETTNLLSSTLLSETKITEENISESFRASKHHDLEKSLLSVSDKPIVEHQEAVRTTKVPAETPPPTPDGKVISRIEILDKQVMEAKEENKRLDDKIEAQIKAIDECQKKIDTVRASRFKYEDYVTMITRGQNEIRDHLNQIFTPGNELAQKFEPVAKEILAKHSRRLEKKCLEWTCLMDQARSVIAKRTEDLNHEMELHHRTLLHQEHMSKAQNEKAESKDAEKQEEKTNHGDTSGESAEICVDDQDNDEECIILEKDVPEVVHEERVVEQSVEESVVKQEGDDDDTDIEEVNSEENRSFTPCQAQRPQ